MAAPVAASPAASPSPHGANNKLALIKGIGFL